MDPFNTVDFARLRFDTSSIGVSTSNSTSLAPLLKTYKEQAGEGQIPDTSYRRPLRAYKVITTMLLDRKFSGT